jgi:hypothetical protein
MRNASTTVYRVLAHAIAAQTLVMTARVKLLTLQRNQSYRVIRSLLPQMPALLTESFRQSETALLDDLALYSQLSILN